MLEPIDKRLSVWKWWSTRVTAGCQLTDLQGWWEGYDYMQPDETGWLQIVANEALMQDYNMHGHGEPFFELGSFTLTLRKVAMETRQKTKQVEHATDYGRIKATRSLTVFKPRIWYADRIYGDGYKWCFRSRVLTR